MHVREVAPFPGRGSTVWLGERVLGVRARHGSTVAGLSPTLAVAWSLPLSDPDFVLGLTGCSAWGNTTVVATDEQLIVVDTITGAVIADASEGPRLRRCRFDEPAEVVVGVEHLGLEESERLVSVDRDLQRRVLWEGEAGTTIGPVISTDWVAAWRCEADSWPPELAVVHIETGGRLAVPGEHYAGIETVGDHQLLISTKSQAEGVRCTLFDLNEGSIVWSTALAADWYPGAVVEHIATAFVVVGDVIVARSGKTGELVALDVASGEIGWRAVVSEHVSGSQDLVVYRDTLVASHGAGLITQLDTDGQTIDEIDLGMACIGAALQASPDRILVAGIDAVYELTLPNG